MVLSLIDQLVSGFDYERVHSFMVSDDWKWDPVVIADTSSRVPTIDELKNLSCSLLRQAAFQLADGKQMYATVFSGGLLATASKPPPTRDKIVLNLYFALERNRVDEDIEYKAVLK